MLNHMIRLTFGNSYLHVDGSNTRDTQPSLILNNIIYSAMSDTETLDAIILRIMKIATNSLNEERSDLWEMLTDIAIDQINDVIEREFTVVDDVLGLLSVTWGLLQGLEDEGSGSGADGDGSLTVLNHDLNVDLDTSPVLGGFLDVFSDLLGGKTARSTSGGEGGSGSNLSTYNLHVDVFLFIGIDGSFWGHFVQPIY